MKLSTVIRAYGGFDELATKDIPAAFGFRIGMMLSALDPAHDNWQKQAAALRHKHGLDQALVTLQGTAKGEGAPALRAIDEAAFQNEYQSLMNSEADVKLESLTLAEITELKGSDGKPIPGLGTIAAKLAPILKE